MSERPITEGMIDAGVAAYRRGASTRDALWMDQTPTRRLAQRSRIHSVLEAALAPRCCADCGHDYNDHNGGDWCFALIPSATGGFPSECTCVEFVPPPATPAPAKDTDPGTCAHSQHDHPHTRMCVNWKPSVAAASPEGSATPDRSADSQRVLDHVQALVSACCTDIIAPREAGVAFYHANKISDEYEALERAVVRLQEERDRLSADRKRFGADICLLEARAFAAEQERDALKRVGAMLGNCAYNLAQDDSLSERYRHSLDASRKAWDAAARSTEERS
jgi:hypothetical protein